MADADVLLHPVRLRIVLALVGRPMTPLELVDHLGDVPQATLYRQVGHLADAGIVEVVDTREVRGRTEHTYGVVEGAASLGPDEVGSADAGQHLRWFGTFVGSLVADFGRYLDRAAGSDGVPDLEADGAGYRQVPLWLDDDEFEEFVADLREVVAARVDNGPGPGRRRRLVTTVVFPDA